MERSQEDAQASLCSFCGACGNFQIHSTDGKWGNTQNSHIRTTLQNILPPYLSCQEFPIRSTAPPPQHPASNHAASSFSPRPCNIRLHCGIQARVRKPRPMCSHFLSSSSSSLYPSKAGGGNSFFLRGIPNTFQPPPK